MAMLITHRGTDVQKHKLANHTWIGRHYKNTIQIDDLRVSAQHCLIYKDIGRGYVIRDLRSKNGTFVNNRKIIEEQLLQSGDIIRVGNNECRFQDSDASDGKVVQVDEELSSTNIHTTISPLLRKRFLPEKEIRDISVLRNDYEKLRVTYELQRDIGLKENIGDILGRILDRTFEFLHYDHGVVLLADRDGALRPRAHKLRKKGDKMYISTTVMKHVQKEKKGIISVDTQFDERFKTSKSLILQGVRSTLAAPILNDKELLGVLMIDSAASANAFSEKDLDLITTVANQTAHILTNSILHENLRLSFDHSIQTLAAVVDARHPFTAGHSQRVMFYSMLVARQMGLDRQSLEVLRFSALLHDIGKIGIADKILLKNGKFSTEEHEEMKKHPIKTLEILENFHFPPELREVPKIACAHHERFNGKGYPWGMKGEEIPLLSRILAIADVFDALTSQRDYPKYLEDEILDSSPMSLQKAIKIIQSESGGYFAPDIVEAFLQCLPLALLRYRGSHFSKEYVDDTIRGMDADILPKA